MLENIFNKLTKNKNYFIYGHDLRIIILKKLKNTLEFLVYNSPS